MFFTPLLKLTRYTATVLTFLVLLLAPGIHTANALSLGGLFGGGGGDLVKDVGNTVQNTIQALSLQSIEQKELIMDGLFFDIAQKALQNMTGDIIKWINSGMDGEPAFVTDVLKYLQEESDKAAADFIYGDQLSNLCGFEVSVRAALAKQYRESNYEGFKEEARCTIENDGAFLAGDFSAAGWTGWFEVIVRPTNTFMGATNRGIMRRNDASAAAQYAAKTEADWGRGIKSKKTCTTVGAGANAREVCSITTPGSSMQDLFSKALGTGIDSLLNADEANEVIGALFGNLAKEAITGTNGLLGLGGNAQYTNKTFGTNGNLSYLDAIRQEQAQKNQNGTPGGNRIVQALATETKALELQLAIVEQISTTTAYFEKQQEPYKSKSCWDLSIPTTLSTTLTQISTRLPATISTVITLQEMADQFNETTDTAGQLGLLEQLSNMQSQGLLSGQTAVVEYDYFLNSELKPFIIDFRKQVASEVRGCS
jgi:hypothetical protein